jgi:glucan-binding YG repeat protein
MSTIPVNSDSPEGHDEAMIAAAEAGTVVAAQETQDKTNEEEESSTEETTEESEQITEESSEENEETTEEVPKPEEVMNGIIEDCTTEFTEQGGLSDESYEKLAGVGLPREMVDLYIKGIEAQQSEAMEPLYEIAGGADELNSLMEWCGSNMEASDIEEYNSLLANSSQKVRTMALKDLKALHDANTSKKPKLIRGGNGSVVTSPAYRSMAEVQRDMANPKYKTDEAFRNDVMKRLAKSNF